MKELTENESWEILKPVCRELFDLVNQGSIKFLSGNINESSGTCKINIKCSHLHFASRGIRDSIGDIEYNEGKIRIGLRSNGVPTNIYVDLESIRS